VREIEWRRIGLIWLIEGIGLLLQGTSWRILGWGLSLGFSVPGEPVEI
jgi:hypothetical protein